VTTPTLKQNLLLVDDDVALVRLLSVMIKRNLGDQFEVACLSDAADARKWLDRNCCHVLLSDIQMPGIDGLEMLQIAKQRNAWTQVIFITGHSSWDKITEAIEKGASDYLVKPIQEGDVVAVLMQAHERLVRWRSAVAATLAASGVGG
jgi:DNA-binding NtrC family response regulator